MKILRGKITESSLYIERFSWRKLKWVFFYKISNTLYPMTKQRVAEILNRITHSDYILWERKRK